MDSKVVAVILNFNGTEDTRECVESVRRMDYPNLGILLVDNASPDKSWKAIPKSNPEIRVIENAENLGYAGGNNAGIRAALKAGCDYVLVLNNDTTADRRALRHLVRAAEADPKATILAPKVLFYDQPSVINSCGTAMDWFRLRPRLQWCGSPDNAGPKDAQERQILPGSALLLKKSLFSDVGFFDEDFFLIHEDAELCLRNRRRGYKNVLVPQAVIFHKVSRALSKYPFTTSYYTSRNFLYLAAKEASWAQRAAVTAGLAALTAKRLALFAFAGPRGRTETAGFLRGISDYCLGRKGRYGGADENRD